jgi:hypothetical protein
VDGGGLVGSGGDGEWFEKAFGEEVGALLVVVGWWL